MVVLPETATGADIVVCALVYIVARAMSVSPILQGPNDTIDNLLIRVESPTLFLEFCKLISHAFLLF